MSNPIYVQIYNELKNMIQKGKYKPGDKIPSEKELAEQWDVSVITPRRALEILRNEGIIVRQAGRGSFVKEDIGTNLSIHKNHPLLGVIFTDFDESFGIGLLNGIENAVNGKANFLFRRSFGDPNNEEEIIKEFLDIGVDGFIILPSHATHFNSAILQLVVDDFPLVLIDRYLKGLGTTAIGTNNVKAARMGANYLMELGHKHISVISPPPSYAVAIEDRLEGILTAFQEGMGKSKGNISIVDNITSTLPNYFKEKYILQDIQIIKNHLKEHKEKTAIFTIEYNIALLVKEAMNELGLKCPDDLSIICFDSPAYKPGALKFTHLVQDQEEIGRRAVKEVLKILEFGNQKQIILLDAKIEEGHSTKKIIQ